MEKERNLTGRNVVMGLQHTFVMFGATVLVPIISGLDIGVALFAAGIGTWIFHIITGFKVPVFLGSSFAFLPGLAAIIGGSIKDTSQIPYAMAGMIVAGLLYVIVGVIFKFVSPDKLYKILPPHVTGPMIILIGMILAPVAIQNANGSNSADIVAKIGIGGCWALAAATFAFGVFIKVAFPKFGLKFLSNLPVLLALIFGYILACILGVVNFKPVIDAAWFGLPKFSLPSFSGPVAIKSISIMVPIAIVTMVEHFGDILAIGNVVGKDFIKSPGIHRTLWGDGIATSVAALMGGPANTTYSENTGAVALTGASNPIIMRIAACFAILLALIPKFTELIATIPGPVIGGISILLFGMISSIGIKNMVDAQINLANPKLLIVSAVMLVLGLGGAAIDLGPVHLSGLGLAAIAGIILNLILRPKDIKSADS